MSGLVKISKALKGHPIRIGLAFVCILLFVGLKFRDYRAPLPVHMEIRQAARWKWR